MRRVFRRPPRLVILFAAACGGAAPADPAQVESAATAEPPASITSVGPATVGGLSGTTVVDGILVQVRDASGKAVPRALIAWTVTTGAAALSAQTTTTDATGVARVSAVLSQPGTSVVRASSAEFPAITTTVAILSLSAPTATTDVTVSNFAFQPVTITVPTNALVRWVWQGTSGVAHTITASREPIFGSPQDALSGDGVLFQFLFAVPGTYTYECTLHSGMRGVVVVQ